MLGWLAISVALAGAWAGVRGIRLLVILVLRASYALPSSAPHSSSQSV